MHTKPFNCSKLAQKTHFCLQSFPKPHNSPKFVLKPQTKPLNCFFKTLISFNSLQKPFNFTF